MSDALKVMRNLTALLAALNTAVQGANAIGDKAVQGIGSVHDKLSVAFTKTNDKQINNDNCAFYFCKSDEATKSAAEYLKYNNVPAVVVTAEHDHARNAFLIVPKEYEKAADKYIGEANRVLVKSEMDRKDFFAIHMGEKVVEFNGVTEQQLRLVRDQLYDKPAAYCVSHQSNGLYKITATEADREFVSRAVYDSALTINGPQGKDVIAYCDRQTDVEKQIVAAITSPTPGKDVIVMDYNNQQNVAIRIQKDRMIEYKNGEPVAIPKKDASEFAARIISSVKEYDAPIVGEMETRSTLQRVPKADEVCTKQEIAACSQSMSHNDAVNGRAETTAGMAEKITSLMISISPDGLEPVRDALNESLSLKEISVWAEQAERGRWGVAELKRLCDNTSLDVTVIEEVLQYARDDINYLLEARANGLDEIVKEVDMTDVPVSSLVDDIIPNIETVDEYTKDERGDRGDRGDLANDVREDYYDDQPDDIPEYFEEERPSIPAIVGKDDR